MKFLGFLFLGLLGSSGLLLADHFIPGNFLQKFISESYMETYGLLVGLNITAAIFLLGQMAEIEIRHQNKISFANTKKELKHNIFFLIFSFFTSFILLTLRPDILANPTKTKIYFFVGINLLVLSLFLMSLYAIYEVFSSAFILSGHNKPNQDKQ